VNLSAQILMPWGRLRSRTSLVTGPTMATMRDVNLVCPAGTGVLSLVRCLTMREMEMG
jgi:hypothetical protein